MGKSEGYDKYRYDSRVLYGTVSDGTGEHAVEDVRTPREMRLQEHSKREGNAGGKGRKRAIVLCLILFLFALTVFLADVLKGGSISSYVALFGGKSEKRTTYYAVYATHSTDAGISYKNAAAIQAEGGAGYVMKCGEEYYVMVSAYPSEAEANSVVEKHRNYGITEIKIYDFSAERHPTLASAESGKDLYKKAYEALYGAANEMASGLYGASELKKKLSPTREEIAAYEESFRGAVSGSEDAVAIEYKVQLKEMLAAFDNLLSHDKDLVAEARYYSVMILHSYSLFTEKYFK
ncbi:MAG: hypothetical protein IJU10_04450 [Clostridia bacterium]|nr:hypothetical protein [Clostridia bacterium]